MTQYQGHPDQHFGCVTYSQHGEDLMLLNLYSLMGIEPSQTRYLDLGAHHPTNISNTKLLYNRGAHGVNVEANPNLIDSFNEQRPRDINILTGVGPTAGTGTFLMYDSHSGRNTFSVFEAELVCTKYGMAVEREFRLPLRTLNDIVAKECGGYFPTLLSCDIEGYDFDVLESADFSHSYPLVIIVEARREGSQRMARMMNLKGFFPYCRMGENLFFINFSKRNMVY